jgi:hypothetical protein
MNVYYRSVVIILKKKQKSKLKIVVSGMEGKPIYQKSMKCYSNKGGDWAGAG